MMRSWLSLLLIGASWQPASAAAVAGAVSASRGAPVIVVAPGAMARPAANLSAPSLTGSLAAGALNSAVTPSIPAVAPNQGLPAADVSIAVPILPVSAVSQGRPAASPVAGVSAAARVAPGAPAPATQESLSCVAGELTRAVSPRAGGVSRAAPAPGSVLTRFYDGASAKPGLLEDAVETAFSGETAFTALEKSQAPRREAASIPTPAAASDPVAQKKAVRQALLGTGIFKFGMEALGITVPLIALTVFGSAVWMATMAVTWGLSMSISSMFAGGLLDRKPVQKVMAGAMATQAVTVAGVIGLLAAGVASPWLVLPLYAAAGVTMGVVVTSRGTLPARLLGRDQEALSKFNAKAHVIYEVTGTLAPLLVGLVIRQFGLISALLFHPPAYLLAAWAFSRLKLEAPAKPEGSAAQESFSGMLRRVLSEVREGARIMWSSKEFRWISLLVVGPALVHRLVEQMFAPIFAKRVLGSPEQSAWLLSSGNFGELLGAVVLLRSMSAASGNKPGGLSRWVRLMAVGSLAAWALCSGAGLWLAIPAFLIMGLTWAANDIGLTSYLQSRLPEKDEGKAMGFLMAAQLAAIMAGCYGLGALFDILPLATALASSVGVVSLLAVVFLFGAMRLKRAQKT